MRGARRAGFKGLIRIVSIVFVLCGACGGIRAASSVQTVANASAGTASTFSLSFAANTAKGNLILVAFDFDTNSTPSTVADSQGNVFTEVGTQLTSPGGARSRVYCAKNIKGGADTVTVNLSSSSAWIELYISEYSGVDTVNPVDAQAGASGSSGSASSGAATTTVTNDVIYGYCVGDSVCSPGAGFSARSTFHGNLIEDKTAGSAGAYAATATANSGWSMQLVALRPTTSDTTPPSVPANLSATAVSQSQINLSWSPSTDNVGVAGYQVFRNGTELGTTTATSYMDVNLAASTTYSYTVTAFDAAGNVSAQSTVAVATTSSTDTQPPSAPTNLTGTSTLPTQANLSWSASTDNVGVAGYHVLRNGTQVGTTSATSYADTGLAASTKYTYTVTAFDAAGNVSAPSGPFAITTAASQPGYRLLLSTNGKYLVNSNTGQPVFLTGDVPQLISLQLSSMSDVNEYLADRQARGFNALWVILADQLDQNGAPNDANGNPPFNGAWWVSPNATYWAHQDAVIQAAIAAGMTVFAMPSFVGNNDPQPAYDTPAYLASPTATIQGYGTFIGSRYANYSNIVWVLGGDYNPISSSGVTIKPKLEALGAAIAAADPNHFVTIEGCQHCGYQASTSPYTAATLPTWLSLNWIAAPQPSVATSCQAAFVSNPFLPPFLGEDSYEVSQLTGFQTRQEGYWEVLSGCYLGRLFGNGPIWSFNATHPGSTTPTWQSQLDSPGSLGEEYMGKLMRSREHWLMAPDTAHTVLTGGFGSGSTLSVAARSSDGQTIIAYLSDGNATAKTISMSAITSGSSSAKAWWYNPQTAVATLIGTFPNSGSQSFTAPDGNDWVLVIDDTSANLPAPGSADLTQNSGPQVTSLACSPTSIMSGASATCQVALNQNAPLGGAAVTLANSNSSALSVPASVMVASGTSMSTFTATAAMVNVPQTATVTGSLNGGSSSTTLSVQAPMMVSSLTCSPSTVTSGGKSTCTITLNQPSPSGGTTVSLTNSNPSALAVPASVTVASGTSAATFTASAAVVTASQSATLTGKVGTSSQSISLTILFVDNVPPSVSIVSPTAGQTVSGTFTVSASASDNVAVAWVQFKVDGAAVGPQIAATPYNYSLVTTSLTNATHTLTAVASDTSGNTTTSAAVSFTVNNASKPIAFVQVAAKSSSAATNTLSLSFPAKTTAGNIILVGFDFDANSTPSSITDSEGNTFTEVGSQLISLGGARSRVYVAKNIKGGADTITVSLSANSAWIELYISEYSGVDAVNPIDAQAGVSGNAGSVSSGTAATTVAGDIVYGYCLGDWNCTAGSGFTARSAFNGNLIEDMTVGNPGSYAATGSANRGWSMQMVALKKAQ
jgi:chitodextrinase